MGVMVAAMSDSVSILLWAIGLSVSVGNSIVLYRVAMVTRKFERLEDKRDREISTLTAEKKKDVEDLSAKLHDASTKLIDERIRAMTHELNNHVNGFSLTLDGLKQRLRDGDETFETLVERDQRTEIQLVQKMDQLKDFMRKELATSDELRRHQELAERRFTQLDKRLDDLARTGSTGTGGGGRQRG